MKDEIGFNKIINWKFLTMKKRLLLIFVLSLFFMNNIYAADGWRNSMITGYSVFYNNDIYVYLKDPITDPNCTNVTQVVFDHNNPNYKAVLASVLMAYSTKRTLGFYIGQNETGTRCLGNSHYGRAVRVRD